ncbi:histidine--tRNA ligase [Candidatus Berkiella aquae]|uniref:Histidine--tRNA ligase n=1 Tax=Candidatus Berkiella aquae TaxID=295108 RepID=A0A0Q9YP01_9GAMM|nr:histidine--tRNA ligase [Candidatus Berkiella aquae]MCS5711045.1 histidine--tRNA ligase [Candidatus Berkiella aquae]
MSLGLKVVKGMKDTLPQEIAAWHYVESQFRSLVQSYGYQEIRMPILEQTELFKRAIGEVTDIVEKEMYTFLDKGGETLTLRPESTAQTVRAVLENNLIRNQSQRLWYYGPMFRRENPQKGRYRQFHQFGVEAFALEGPDVDAEQILMMARLWRQVGLDKKIALQLNSLGLASERATYRQALVDYFRTRYDMLDEDSKRRLESNPLRILDSKNPAMQPLITEAPILLDYLGEESLAHFTQLQSLLKASHITFEVNPRLVRGLDYYTHTVYEWVTTELGSQGTVCAGGRYNDLVSQMGGPATQGVGFAMGVERLIMLLLDNQLIPHHDSVDVYCVAEGDLAQQQVMVVAEQLRDALPQLSFLMNCGGGSFKSQFKKADKSGASFALILGEEEVKNQTLSIKALREEMPQQTLNLAQAIEFFKAHIKRG